jgi:hypothetical protein
MGSLTDAGQVSFRYLSDITTLSLIIWLGRGRRCFENRGHLEESATVSAWNDIM